MWNKNQNYNKNVIKMPIFKKMVDRMRNEDKRLNYDKLRALKKIKEDKNQTKIEDFFTKTDKK